LKERAIIWGTGDGFFGGLSAHMQMNSHFDIIAFVDNDIHKHGTIINELPVLSPDEVYSSFPASTLIIIAAKLHHEAICKQLHSRGFTNLLFTYRVFDKNWTNLIKGVLFDSNSESYSQMGEDLIVDSIFKSLGIYTPQYAEIGVMDPISGSNTYLFYSRLQHGYMNGGGILVDANPKVKQLVCYTRPNDRFIAKGIGTQRGDFEFYETSSGIATFVKEFYDAFSSVSEKDINGIFIPVVLFDDIFLGEETQYVSLDIEGLDVEVIKSIDFAKYPELIVFCSESVFGGDTVRKHMNINGFICFAQTRYNEIYLRKSVLPTVLMNYDNKRIYEIMNLIDSGAILI